MKDDSSNPLQTARHFLCEFNKTKPAPNSELEELRLLSLIGFTALDALVSAYWKVEILPDWENQKSLLHAATQNSNLVLQLPTFQTLRVQKSQIIASLKFMDNTFEESKFSPTFLDCGLLIYLNQDELAPSPHQTEFANLLCELQSLRNAAIHTGRPYNLSIAKESLQKLNQVFKAATLVHPVFKELVNQSRNLESKYAA